MPNLRFSYSAGASFFLAAGGSGSLHTPPVQTTLGFFGSGGGVAGASLDFPGCSCACADVTAARRANVIRVFFIRVSTGVSAAGGTLAPGAFMQLSIADNSIVAMRQERTLLEVSMVAS